MKLRKIDSETFVHIFGNRLNLTFLSLLVNFSCGFRQIMTICKSLSAIRVILSNVRTNSNVLDLISISVLSQFENVMHMCNDSRVFKPLQDRELRPSWCKPCGSTMLPLGCSCFVSSLKNY